MILGIYNPSQKLSELLIKICQKKGLDSGTCSCFNLYGYPIETSTNLSSIEGKSVFIGIIIFSLFDY
jgi:hypothetical protein